MFFSHDNILSLLSNEITGYSNSIILIKDRSGLCLKDFSAYLDSFDGNKCFYFRLQSRYLYEPYFPFLKFIKDESGSSIKSLKDLLDKTNIYPMHEELFSNYLMFKKADRREELLFVDYSYEKTKLYETIREIFNEYSRKNHIYIFLENINHIEYSTLEWLRWLVDNNEKYKFKIIMTMTSYDYCINELQDDFENFIDTVETNYSLLEIGDNKYSKIETNEKKICDDYEDRFMCGESAFQFFALQEAVHYYKNEYYKIQNMGYFYFDEKSQKVLERLGDIYLIKGEYRKCYFYYDRLLRAAVESNNEKIKSSAFQKLAMLNIFRMKFARAEKFAKNSYKIAVAIGDDYLKFKAYELLFWINEKGKYRTTIENIGYEEEFIYLAEKYNQKNRLAYFLTHSYNIISFRGPADQSEYYYNKGHAIAKALKNENCILSAHLKTALVYAVNGLYDISQKYYEKIENILIDMKDNFRLAQTYNGMGYYFLVRGNYELADEYYNKALQNLKTNWNFDEICMTLLNKSINAILACDYQTAEEQMEVLIVVIKKLKLSRLRLISISKIYGIMALNNFYLGNTYRSYSLLSKINIINIAGQFYEDDEEHFLKNFVQALMLRKKKMLSDSFELFMTAHKNIKEIKGSLKCFYPKFLFEYYGLLNEIGKSEEADKIRKTAYEYCEKNSITYYINLFKNNVMRKYSFKQDFSQNTWIIEAAKQESSISMLNDKIDEINFINSFQEVLTTINEKNQILTNSITLLENKFAIDFSLLLSDEDYSDNILYCSNNKEISRDMSIKLRMMLESCKAPFVSSDNGKLNDILEKISGYRVKSVIYIPIIKENKCLMSFLCMTKVDDDIVNNTVILNSSNLRIIKIAIRQLGETIERIKWQEKLIESVSTDMLTKLYNRQYFYNKISFLSEKCIEKKTSSDMEVSLLYIDLDNFKYYNDTFGHTIGDWVLIWFAEILKSAAGDNGTAIRYGGDEFLLFIENCDMIQSKKIAESIYYMLKLSNGFKEKVGKMTNEEVLIPDEHLIGCSIGIVCDKMNKNFNVKRFIDCADKSLYEAKRNGKGKAVAYE